MCPSVQLALPLEAMPWAMAAPVHCVGVDERLDAVAALPEVLLEMVEGRSPATNERNVGVAACPEPGPANTLLADCARSCGARVPLVVVGEPGTEEL